MNDILWPAQAVQFRMWLGVLQLTQKGAAQVLGIKPRDMRYYCAGQKPAPPVVKLAMQRLIDVNTERLKERFNV